MSETRGMSRRETLQYQARVRRMTGTSKLAISMAAHEVIELDDKALALISAFGSTDKKLASKQVDKMMRKLDKTKPAKWGDGGAYSPEVMYGTEEENNADWDESGLIDTANDTMNEEAYG
jgi:hypothetical protein